MRITKTFKNCAGLSEKMFSLSSLDMVLFLLHLVGITNASKICYALNHFGGISVIISEVADGRYFNITGKSLCTPHL